MFITDFLKWVEKGAKNFRWYDLSLLKLSSAFGILFLLSVWNDFAQVALSVEWYWYFVLMILSSVPLVMKLFKN
jgi:hypothetical protein